MDIFEQILKLEENWNGYGAKPFSREHVEIAKQFYMQLKEGFEVFPTAADSIQIEYEDENEYIEFEVYVDGRIKMYREEKR